MFQTIFTSIYLEGVFLINKIFSLGKKIPIAEKNSYLIFFCDFLERNWNRTLV